MALFGPSTATKNALTEARLATETARGRGDTAFAAGMDFYRGFNNRNRPELQLRGTLAKQIRDYNSGRDVSQIFRGQKAVSDAVANQGRAIMQLTGGLGANALTKSDRSMKRAQNLAYKELFNQASQQFAQGASQLHQGNIQNMGNLQAMLTQDRLAGLQTLNQGFANAATQAGLQGQLFGMQRQKDADSFARILGMANLGVGAFTGIGGVLKKT